MATSGLQGQIATDTNAVTRASGRQKWHDKYSHLGTGPIAVDPFVSQAQFELERDRIFKKVWLHIGRVEQIPSTGDYFVKDLAVCNTSVIVSRGRDGSVNAFHNMCSHRGNKILWDEDGTCQNFTCKFHGWSYGLDGQLKFVPDEESFFDLKKKTLGMTPVAVGVWEGFIFINLDPQESLTDYLGEFTRGLEGYPFGEWSQTCFSWKTELKANWKVVKDAFQEVYHVAFLHRNALPDIFNSSENPFSHALNFTLFPKHVRASLYGNPEHQPAPVEALAYKHGSLIIRNDYSTDHLPPGVNATRSKTWSLDLNVIFPSFFLDVSDGTYFTHHMWPVAVDRTVWEVHVYMPEAKSPAHRFSQEYSKIITRDGLMEDGRTLEETQAMLGSGAKQEFVLQDEELLVRHSHHVIQQMIRD